MIYRPLGRTGFSVSQLGFGAMRLPMKGQGKDAIVDRELSTAMIRRALEAGVNYVDSAVGYCNHDSQRAVGDALKGWRDRVIVSTKNPYYDEDETVWWKNLEDSLQRLQVERIDIYNHHGLSWQAYVEKVEPRVGKWMRKAKDQGLIRHICCSSHDTCPNVIRIIDSGYVDVITVQYNLLDRKLEEAIAHAHQKAVGVAIMGPVGGGRLGGDSEVLQEFLPGVRRVPELALRFVLSNPHVSVALSGMSTMRHVEENLRVAADGAPLSEADRAAIAEHLQRLARMAELYCTGCNYCVPCPNEVAIPKIFQRYNLGKVYGLWAEARRQYAALGTHKWDPGRRADACTECGACEEKCPQKIPIRKQLKEAHAALADVAPSPAGASAPAKERRST